jgi:uncharacterized protein involved in exopolysaccharide biosynthesis
MDIQLPVRSSLRDFLHVLFKRKVQILLFFFATVCTVTIGTFLMKPTYEATSQILVKIGRENLYVPTVPNSGNNPVINVNREEQINSEIEILKSPSLATQVVRALGPATLYEGLDDPKSGFLASLKPSSPTPISPVEAAVLKFEKDLSVEAIKKSNVIQVNYKNSDPRVAAAVVNALVSLFMDRHLAVFKNPESYSFFEEQSRILRNQLTDAEKRLEAFKKKHDLSSLDEQRSLLLKEDSALHTALNLTESQIVETRNRLKQLRLQLDRVPRTVPQSESVDHNPLIINTLQASLVELELKEKKLLDKYTEQSRLVQNVRDEIAMVRQKLTDQEQKRYGNSSSGLNLTYQRLEDDLLGNEAELSALEAQTQHPERPAGRVSGSAQQPQPGRGGTQPAQSAGGGLPSELPALSDQVRRVPHFKCHGHGKDHQRQSARSGHRAGQTNPPQETAQSGAGRLPGGLRWIGPGLFHGVPG